MGIYVNYITAGPLCNLHKCCCIYVSYMNALAFMFVTIMLTQLRHTNREGQVGEGAGLTTRGFEFSASGKRGFGGCAAFFVCWLSNADLKLSPRKKTPKRKKENRVGKLPGKFPWTGCHWQLTVLRQAVKLACESLPYVLLWGGVCPSA